MRRYIGGDVKHHAVYAGNSEFFKRGLHRRNDEFLDLAFGLALDFRHLCRNERKLSVILSEEMPDHVLGISVDARRIN